MNKGKTEICEINLNVSRYSNLCTFISDEPIFTTHFIGAKTRYRLMIYTAGKQIRAAKLVRCEGIHAIKDEWFLSANAMNAETSTYDPVLKDTASWMFINYSRPRDSSCHGNWSKILATWPVKLHGVQQSPSATPLQACYNELLTTLIYSCFFSMCVSWRLISVVK